MNNCIYEYYQKITDGSITTGKYIKHWYEYIVKGMQNKSFYFNKKKADILSAKLSNHHDDHQGVFLHQLCPLDDLVEHK